MNIQPKRVIMLGFDGADPRLLKQLQTEGKLPNISKVIAQGATTADYGMTGVVPTVTPPGWCSISTGANPGTHGITCFWNHTYGDPLDKLDYGFLSTCCKVETIWEAYAKAGKTSLVVNYPTSYPPKISENLIMIDGSMLTPMFNAIVGQEMFYECKIDCTEITQHFKDQNTSGTNCIVEGEVESKQFDFKKKNLQQSEVDEITAKARSRHGSVVRKSNSDVTKQISGGVNNNETLTPLKAAQKWNFDTTGMLEAVLPMNDGQKRRFVLLRPNHTVAIYFSKNDTTPQAEIQENAWSDFIYDTFNYNDKEVKVAYKIKVNHIAADNSALSLFVTCQMNLEEDKYVFPHALLPEIYQNCGPIAKTFVYGGEEHSKHRIVMETWTSAQRWQANAINYLLQTKDIDLVYTHFHIIDELEHLWIEKTVPGCCADWEHYRDLVLETYDVMDEIVGTFLPLLEDNNTAIFITSDHALLPKNPDCDYQPLGDAFGLPIDWMMKEGYLALKEIDGKEVIDWSKTKATFQRSSYVYINLKGRDPEGCVEPEDYNVLVEEIISKLYAFRDPKHGKRVVDACLKRDGMAQVGLWGDNCGDIFFVLNPEFAHHHANTWSETQHYNYSTKAIFLACGAGIKKGYTLNRRVHMIDVAPTIAALQNAPLPAECEGGAVYQIFE